jgi:hypothetical protein
MQPFGLLDNRYSSDDPRFALNYAGGGVSGETPTNADAIGRLAYGLTNLGGVQDAAGLLGGPSLRENVSGGNYLDAAMQGVGVLPVVGGVAKGLLGAGALYKAAKMGAPEIKAALDPSVVRMFLGPGAKTADKAALAEAEAMHSSGASREDIIDKTGWFKGVDGNWRFEVPDNEASITPWAKETHSSASIPFMKQQGKGPTALATDRYIEHPELERAYWPTSEEGPSVYFDVRKGPKDSSGVYHPDTDALTIKAPYTDSKSIALHELQHAIQKREDFASGGSPGPVKKGTPAWDIYKENPAITIPAMPRELFAQTLPEGASVAGNYYHYLINLDKKNKQIVKQAKEKASQEGYRRLAGEVEARTTQKRMDMTADERKARYPWLDYDVPEDQQIVRFRGLLGK